MRIVARCCCLAALFLSTTSGVWAQSAGAADNQGLHTVINLNVTVTGRDGKPVTNLQKSDFTLFDNGAPQKITTFQNMGLKPAPVQVIIIMDDVNTGYFFLPDERRRMEHFLRSNGGKLPFPTSLIFFTDADAPVPQGFTQDGNKLADEVLHRPITERGISTSAGAGGESDLYGKSLRMLAQTIETASMSAGRTIIIWVSPGWPTLYGPGNSLSKSDQRAMYSELENFTGDLRTYQVTLYMINPEGVTDRNGFKTTSTANAHSFDYEHFLKPVLHPLKMQAGYLSLQGMVLHSGGLLQGWNNNIAGMMQRVYDDIPNYYELTYDAPLDKADKYHAIEVKVDKPAVKVRTTAGYYSGH